MGSRLVIPPDEAWKPIVGTTPEQILKQHPDPLGALQRGEECRLFGLRPAACDLLARQVGVDLGSP